MLHRDIMQPELPAPAMTVDHLDKDSMNCRRYNMRICTLAQNMMNRHNFKRKTPGPRGVYPRGKRWLCLISNGTQHGYIYLGTYATAEEAARVWDKKAYEMRGEYAQLNYPDELPLTEHERALQMIYKENAAAAKAAASHIAL